MADTHAPLDPNFTGSTPIARSACGKGVPRKFLSDAPTCPACRNAQARSAPSHPAPRPAPATAHEAPTTRTPDASNVDADLGLDWEDDDASVPTSGEAGGVLSVVVDMLDLPETASFASWPRWAFSPEDDPEGILPCRDGDDSGQDVRDMLPSIDQQRVAKLVSMAPLVEGEPLIGWLIGILHELAADNLRMRLVIASQAKIRSHA